MGMSAEHRVRPYIHSPIARAVYDRLLSEQKFNSIDRSQWYRVNLNAIRSEELQSKFVQLSWDDETQEFVDQSTDKSSWLGTQLFHATLRFFFGWVSSKTSMNGFLNRGSMFVFSEKQFLKLLNWEPEHLEETVLDLGAGDGNVTARFSGFFKETFVTEVSPVMRKILLKRGFYLKEVETWHSDETSYSMISALNLLDRCDEPLSLLRQIPKKLRKGGLVLLAIVLPLSQYVESNFPYYKPTEVLEVKGKSIEDQVESLYECVLKPLGYKLHRWTRLPYLCEGDLHQPFYWLHDIVLVLSHTDTL